jgi:hypothetical protein
MHTKRQQQGDAFLANLHAQISESKPHEGRKFARRRYFRDKIAQTNHMKAMPYNKVMQTQYFGTKPHEGNVSAKQWSIEHFRTTRSKPVI